MGQFELFSEISSNCTISLILQRRSVTPDRPLVVGDMEIEAYVLADGTRVLTQAEFQEAMGRHRKANVRYSDGEEPVPPILQGKGIKPFISAELLEKSQPIKFQTPQGVRASGYRAQILPEAACDEIAIRWANL